MDYSSGHRLIGVRAEDAAGGKLGRVVAVVHRSDGSHWVLVSRRTMWRRHTVLMPLENASARDGSLVLRPPTLLHMVQKHRGTSDAA